MEESKRNPDRIYFTFKGETYSVERSQVGPHGIIRVGELLVKLTLTVGGKKWEADIVNAPDAREEVK